MKLKKLEKNKVKKVLLLVIFGIVFLVIGIFIDKTFSLYQVSKSFEFVNGKVNYYGHSDVYFAYYNRNTWLEEMPKQGNSENLGFEKAECDNNTTVEWNEERWAPIVLNLTKTKTRCTLYFSKATAPFPGKKIPIAEAGTDGLYKVYHNNLSELNSEWNKTEYRYAGVNPDNYVKFNNELWRIIGLVNVQTTTSGRVEQRVKIIRTNGISGQRDFGTYAWDRGGSGYSNNWTTSKLKDMLNGIYYNSGKGECYTGNTGAITSQSTCDFSGSSATYPKGLDDTAKNMIDSEVIWNIGGNAVSVATDAFYEKERGTTAYNNEYPNVWTTANDGTYHKGIGLMYPSDYGYAVGGSVRNTCLKANLLNYNTNNCFTNNWLKASNGYQWLLPSGTHNSIVAFVVYSDGLVGYLSSYYAYGVWPTVYMNSSVKITGGSGTTGSPYILSL